MDTKEAFEKWFESREIEMKKNGLGLISIARTKIRYWDAWQASRSAIVIPSSSDSEYWFEGTFQCMRYERDVEKAITSHRIKGKE